MIKTGDMFYSVKDETVMLKADPDTISGSCFKNMKCVTLICVEFNRDKRVSYCNINITFTDKEGLTDNINVKKGIFMTLESFENYLKRYEFKKLDMTESYIEEEYTGSSYKIHKMDNPMVREYIGMKVFCRIIFPGINEYRPIAGCPGNYFDSERNFDNGRTEGKSLLITVISLNSILSDKYTPMDRPLTTLGIHGILFEVGKNDNGEVKAYCSAGYFDSGYGHLSYKSRINNSVINNSGVIVYNPYTLDLNG